MDNWIQDFIIQVSGGIILGFIMGMLFGQMIEKRKTKSDLETESIKKDLEAIQKIIDQPANYDEWLKTKHLRYKK